MPIQLMYHIRLRMQHPKTRLLNQIQHVDYVFFVRAVLINLLMVFFEQFLQTIIISNK